MRADRVEVSWDQTKSIWLLRIVSGEEVIRRHCKAPKDADEQTLRSVAKKPFKKKATNPKSPTSASAARRSSPQTCHSERSRPTLFFRVRSCKRVGLRSRGISLPSSWICRGRASARPLCATHASHE